MSDEIQKCTIQLDYLDILSGFTGGSNGRVVYT